MLTEKELVQIATEKMIDIFGKPYLRENFANTCKAQGMIDDCTFMFFLGFKGRKDLPDRESESHGWVVYGEVLINIESGKIIKEEYVLE